MTRAFRVAAILILTLCATRPAAAQTPDLDYGRYPVGFRTVAEVDHSRTVQARTTFDGAPAQGDVAMPIRIAIWYPAGDAETGVRMTTEAYRLAGRPDPVDRAALARDWKAMLGFAGLQTPEEDLLRALEQPRRARRDGVPADGRFPLLVSGVSPSGGATLGELLASHGFVVVSTPSLPRTGTQQASQPALALETQARNMEWLASWARALPYVDDTRIGIVGVNFDGLAALVYEMRNMRADAVVSLDGWEGKSNGKEILLRSPYYDPVRMRIPYLVFEQDEPSATGAIARDRQLWSALKYSARDWFVLKGFGHTLLISDQFTAPGLPDRAREGYRFVYGMIREFLDEHVKKAATPAAALPRARQAGLLAEEAHAAALAPVPTGEELERLVMSGGIARAAEILRRARAENPDVEIADEGTLNLYAFRYTQQQKLPEVLAIRRLTADAFPQSARAAYNLGLACLASGEPDAARRAMERALTLVDADVRLPPADRGRLRDDIRQRLGG
jgi:hypothetical protein